MDEVTVKVVQHVGFLEESAGVKSTARLTIIWCMVLASIVTGFLCWYVAYTMLHSKPDAAVVGALAGVLTALVFKGAVALWTRNGPKDD